MSNKIYIEGTHRTKSPTETLKHINQFRKEMGITRLANVTGLDRIGIPVYMACRPNSRSLAVSQGKGISHEAAKVSALMESIEAYHAERIELPVKLMSYKDLSERHNVIDIAKLSKLTTSEFNENLRLPWIEGYDLLNKQKKWLPYECVHTDYVHPFSYNHGHFVSDTNGLASGNTISEAINHGLHEVIERDALATYSLNKQRFLNRKLDLSTVDIPYFKSIYTKIGDAQSLIGVWDITNDLGIPTFICKILHIAPSGLRIRPAYGSGTHLSKKVAFLRAVTEAAQSRLTFIAGTRDDQYTSVYEEQISEERFYKWHHEIVSKNSLNFSDILSFETNSMDDDQKLLLKYLKKAGLAEAMFVDLTLPKYNLPVVKVVVPGLEGISYSGKRIVGERGRTSMKMEYMHA